MTHREFKEIQKEIKLYRIGEFDTIAAQNSDEAMKCIAKTYGCKSVEEYKTDYEEDCETYQWTIEEMNERLIISDDPDEIDKTMRVTLDELILAGQKNLFQLSAMKKYC